jgi:hypothetical protein
MSFIARLGTDVIAVETGATTPLSVEIVNRDDNADQFELVIEGLDPDWTAVPVPVVTIEGRESQQEKVFFKPPRVSESSAGNYPFVLKVRSLTSGEIRNVQGVLTVKHFDHLSLEISPKKGVISPTRKQNRFEVNLINLGNTEHTVQLFGSDPEEACAFEFDQQQLSVGPGQQKTVFVTVNPTGKSLVSGSRLFGFTLSARSLESPSVGAVAQAQLEQRPLLSIGAIIVTTLVVLLAGLWVALIPKPPTFELNVDRTTIERGQPVMISWKAGSDSTMVHLKAQDKAIYDGSQREGTQNFLPNLAPDQSNFEIDGYSERDGKESLLRRVVVTVIEKKHVEMPIIDSFEIEPKNPVLGGKILVKYLVHNAATVDLQPMGTHLPPINDQPNQNEVEIDSLDVKTLTLVAANSEGQAVRKEIRVKVTQASKAKVIAFSVDQPKLTAPGTVKVNWQVNDQAVRTEIKIGDQLVQVDPTGSRDLPVTATTKLTLTCFDNDGVPDSRTIVVTLTPPPPVAPPTTPATDAGGSTAGAQPTTTPTTPPGGVSTGPTHP